MQLNIVSYNGHNINDGTNYVAWFPAGQPSMPRAQPNFAPRSHDWPKLSSKDIGETTIYMHIECKGTIHSQLDELKSWFHLKDYTPRALIVSDAADSSRQWYVMGYAIDAIKPASEGAGNYIIALAIDEPLWRTVAVSTASWAIAASGATKSLTVLGNETARPIFTITIGAAKNGGYAKKIWKPLYNPLTLDNGKPFCFTLNTAALVADTTISNQINSVGGITAGALSIPIDTSVGGGLSSAGGMCYVDSEQIYYTGISAGVMTVYDDGAGTTGRGWGGTTAATHADNAVMAKSHLLANGNDLRVLDGQTEIDRWLGGMNTTATNIWIVPSFQKDLTLTLDTAIASSGSVTTITVKKTSANLAALKRLPPNFMFYIGSEVFFGTDVIPASYKFTCVARAQKGTSMAAHASGATIRWLEHDFILVYGKPLDTAPETDDSYKPILDLVNSTNTSWVFTELMSSDQLRSGGWTPTVINKASPDSDIYTGSHGADADPATELGFMLKVFQASGVWKSETFKGSIGIYHPAGFTTITVTGDKYRYSTGWPSFTFQKSNDGATWTTVFTEATPSSAQTWGSISSHSSVTLSGTFRHLRWFANGTLAGTANNSAYLEMQGATLVIDSSKILQTPFSTSTEDNYHLDATFTVVETGDSITLKGAAAVGAVIVVDCDNETIKLNGNDGGINPQWNTEREAWLDLPSPKQSATCTLQYDETGAANVSIDISWENRSFL